MRSSSRLFPKLIKHKMFWLYPGPSRLMSCRRYGTMAKIKVTKKKEAASDFSLRNNLFIISSLRYGWNSKHPWPQYFGLPVSSEHLPVQNLALPEPCSCVGLSYLKFGKWWVTLLQWHSADKISWRDTEAIRPSWRDNIWVHSSGPLDTGPRCYQL